MGGPDTLQLGTFSLLVVSHVTPAKSLLALESKTKLFTYHTHFFKTNAIASLCACVSHFETFIAVLSKPGHEMTSSVEDVSTRRERFKFSRKALTPFMQV